MPKLFDALPFYTGGGRNASRKGYPLDKLLELRFGAAPVFGTGQTRGTAPLPGGPVSVRSHQMLIWLTVGFRNRPRSDHLFPAILDPGCNHTFVASAWHLENWAHSSNYDFRAARILNLQQELVANTPPGAAAPAPTVPRHVLGKKLGSVWHLWQTGLPQNVLPVIETDLWLTANLPGERDELATPDACYRLQIDGILVRPERSARPPLLGMRALREGTLILANRAPCRLDRLDIDLQNCEVSLRYP